MASRNPDPRPAVVVDIVVFGFDGSEMQVLLTSRRKAPGGTERRLPGGRVRIDETLDEAAARELETQAGIKKIFLEQLYTFGALARDPRERVDKRNFRKKVLSYGLLEPLDEYQQNVPHRAAQLFRFDRRQYRQLSKSGFYFEL